VPAAPWLRRPVRDSLHVCVLSGTNAGALDCAPAFLVHGSFVYFLIGVYGDARSARCFVDAVSMVEASTGTGQTSPESVV
jgi:hypothetical protein